MPRVCRKMAADVAFSWYEFPFPHRVDHALPLLWSSSTVVSSSFQGAVLAELLLKAIDVAFQDGCHSCTLMMALIVALQTSEWCTVIALVSAVMASLWFCMVTATAAAVVTSSFEVGCHFPSAYCRIGHFFPGSEKKYVSVWLGDDTSFDGFRLQASSKVCILVEVARSLWYSSH